MFTGLTVANILGVPFGTWLGQAYGWRSTFWAVTLIGIAALAVIAFLVPKDKASDEQEEASQGVLAVLGRRAVILGLLTTVPGHVRSEEHTSTPVTNAHLVCRLLLEKKKHT